MTRSAHTSEIHQPTLIYYISIYFHTNLSLCLLLLQLILPRKSYLLTIKPIDHQASQPLSLLTIEPINLWCSFTTLKPFGLLEGKMGQNLNFQTLLFHQICGWTYLPCIVDSGTVPVLDNVM